MYSWLSSIVDFPAGANDMIVSGAVIISILCVGFILYCLSRFFR